MAGRRNKRGTVSGYFRQVFKDHPEWLKEKSNEPILAQYRTDHGMAADADIEKKIKSNLANLKSALRKQSRGSGKPGVQLVSTRTGHRLEALEELIDECLTLAKNLDRDALGQIISLLRRARNEVVWKIGE